MSDDRRDGEGSGREEKVGYCRPPKEHQFKPGQPSPRKGKKQAKAVIDVSELLSEPMRVTVDGKAVLRDEFEVRLSSLLKRALKEDVAALGKVLAHADRDGLLEIKPQKEIHPSRVLIPKDWDPVEWKEMYDRFGAPPWKGDRDGLIPEDRWNDLLAIGKVRGARDGRN